MYVHLLEIVYKVEQRDSAEKWLTHTNHDGVVISTERYGDEILAILASEQALEEPLQQLRQHPSISFCEEKRRALYRITTVSTSEHTLCSFPFRFGEEWYIGPQKTMYLSLQSHRLSNKQLCWLRENVNITGWQDQFPLTSALAVCE